METGDGKHIFGLVKVGEKGQIVIPKAARTLFNIQPGDSLLILGDEERGIAIIKSDSVFRFAHEVLNASMLSEETDERD